MVITDNLSSHNSASTRTWLLDIPASSTPSSPPAPAGSTCRKAAGAPWTVRSYVSTARKHGADPLHASASFPAGQPLASSPSRALNSTGNLALS